MRPSLTRFACGIFALMLVATPMTDATTVDTAARILARHKAYVGWAYGDGKVRSIRMSGNVGDRPFTRFTRGSRYRIHVGESPFEYDEGFTGTGYWFARSGGFIVPLSGKASGRLATVNSILNEALSPRFCSVFQGLESAIAVLHCTPPGGVPADVFFDVKTAAIVSAELYDAPVHSTLLVNRYADVAGRKVISEWSLSGLPGYRATKISFQPVVVESDLLPPAPKSAWHLRGSASFPVSLSPTLAPDGAGAAILFTARVNGVEGRFTLNTGLNTTVLSKTFAQKLQQRPLSENSFKDERSGQIRLVQTLAVGESTFVGNIPAFVDDSMSFESDGMVGTDLLAGTILKLDLRQGVAYLFDPSLPLALEPDSVAIPMEVDFATLRVAGRIDGRIFSAKIDTGYPFALFLDPSFQHIDVPHERMQTLSINGTAFDKAWCGRANHVEIGSIGIRDVEVCTARFGFYPQGAIIGLDLIRRFNWTFDYPHSRVVLTKNGI